MEQHEKNCERISAKKSVFEGRVNCSPDLSVAITEVNTQHKRLDSIRSRVILRYPFLTYAVGLDAPIIVVLRILLNDFILSHPSRSTLVTRRVSVAFVIIKTITGELFINS
jgi:hypothetical protein